jgi:hypothetical protein
MKKLIALLFLISMLAQAQPVDQLVNTARYPANYMDGQTIPYILTENSPKTVRYAVVLMPGRNGVLNPYMLDDKLMFDYRGNFLIRSRHLFTDHETVAVSTDASQSAERMTALVNDVKQRYPGVKIYFAGTSRSTIDSMTLSKRMGNQAEGYIHTASMNVIGKFDTTQAAGRHLIVHHVKDGCRLTGFGWAEYNHKTYGTRFIPVEGGVDTGDVCSGSGHHGFNGVEKETIDRIMSWVKEK